ncbi:MAG: 16S rRNA (guanine(527)-N(7))-methyltransferase RsmG [Croceitalea sp.]|nr:16S rRNA (guanine(527)-N(7))-methyltransferase RsmG [Croceitalea sp.]
MNAEIIFKYFTTLTQEQKLQFEQLEALYQDWNQKINVVSRKDIDELYLRHVLHSLGIAKIQTFNEGAAILDVGTGGGFPGIPLAILFPETNFTMVDAIGKKIKVVHEVIEGLQLQNARAIHTRVEDLPGKFDFVISRAVAAMPTFVHWTKGKVKKDNAHARKNGILYLKGGNLTEELANYRTAQIFELQDYFEEPFFETKKVVYLPQKARTY